MSAADSYAGRTGQGAGPTWMELRLYRDNETIPYTVNNEELAKMLYKRFQFGEFDIVKIDYSAMKSIKIKVRAGVNVENHKNTSAYAVRPGLWVLPMKELKQEKQIKLSWVPAEMTNAEINEVLELFGTVTSEATDLKFVIDDKEDELTKRLRNVYCNDRKVTMVVEKNIPSYIKIQNRKIKVWYRGQQFTCARCLQSHLQCKGKAVARECQKFDKENKLKRDFDEWWEEVKKSTPVRSAMGDDESFTTETLKIFFFPADATREDVHNWVLQHDVMVHEDQIVESDTATMWFIIHVGIKNMKSTINKLNKQMFGLPPHAKFINCAPATLTTPQKAQYGIREPQQLAGENGDGSFIDSQPTPPDLRHPQGQSMPLAQYNDPVLAAMSAPIDPQHQILQPRPPPAASTAAPLQPVTTTAASVLTTAASTSTMTSTATNHQSTSSDKSVGDSDKQKTNSSDKINNSERSESRSMLGTMLNTIKTTLLGESTPSASTAASPAAPTAAPDLLQATEVANDVPFTAVTAAAGQPTTSQTATNVSTTNDKSTSVKSTQPHASTEGFTRGSLTITPVRPAETTAANQSLTTSKIYEGTPMSTTAGTPSTTAAELSSRSLPTAASAASKPPTEASRSLAAVDVTVDEEPVMKNHNPLMSTAALGRINDNYNTTLDGVSDISRMISNAEISDTGAVKTTRSDWWSDEEHELQGFSSSAVTSTISKPSSRIGKDDISSVSNQFDNTRIRSAFHAELERDQARHARRLSTTLKTVTQRDKLNKTTDPPVLNLRPGSAPGLLNQMAYSIAKTNERSSKRPNASPLENHAKMHDGRPTPESSMYVQDDHVRRTRSVFENNQGNQPHFINSDDEDFVPGTLSSTNGSVGCDSEASPFVKVGGRRGKNKKKKYKKSRLSLPK